LLQEIASITEILNDFREQNSSLAKERQKQKQKKRELLSSGSTERGLLEQQIKMLLSQSSHKPSSQVLSGTGSKKVLSYIASTDPAFSLEEDDEDDELLSMSWARSSSGKTSSLPNTARPMSALSSARGSQSARSCPLSTNSLTNEVIGSSKCLNANDIKEIVGCLRRGFKKEFEGLKEEIDMLMAMFDEEDARVNEENKEVNRVCVRELLFVREREMKKK
jgi:hypothetical protein